MLWDRVLGHQAAVAGLRRALEKGRLGHAYLFTGPSAVGKFIVARTLAASVLCPQGGCGACNVCRRVFEEKHPDVTVIRPSGTFIPIEVVRGMRLDAFRKPVESERKFYIIKNAERMKEETASALLKVLEEPPQNVIFVMLTANPGAILPTIRSRCEEIRFTNIPVQVLKEYLEKEKGLDASRADLVARLTGGVLGRAMGFCDEPWRLKRRDNVIRAAMEIRGADLNRTLETAAELHREVRAPVNEIRVEYQNRKEQLQDGSLDDVSARRLAKDLDEECRREQRKEETRGMKEVLFILAWWYRDILVRGQGGNPSLLVNSDFRDEIEREAQSVSVDGLLRCIDVIGEGMRGAELNIPSQLNIESTIFGIQEALGA